MIPRYGRTTLHVMGMVNPEVYPASFRKPHGFFGLLSRGHTWNGHYGKCVYLYFVSADGAMDRRPMYQRDYHVPRRRPMPPGLKRIANFWRNHTQEELAKELAALKER